MLAGVLVPPVGSGVERAEGNSEVKMVPEEGVRMYFWVIVARRACENPTVYAYQSEN